MSNNINTVQPPASSGDVGVSESADEVGPLYWKVLCMEFLLKGVHPEVTKKCISIVHDYCCAFVTYTNPYDPEFLYPTLDGIYVRGFMSSMLSEHWIMFERTILADYWTYSVGWPIVFGEPLSKKMRLCLIGCYVHYLRPKHEAREPLTYTALSPFDKALIEAIDNQDHTIAAWLSTCILANHSLFSLRALLYIHERMTCEQVFRMMDRMHINDWLTPLRETRYLRCYVGLKKAMFSFSTKMKQQRCRRLILARAQTEFWRSCLPPPPPPPAVAAASLAMTSTESPTSTTTAAVSVAPLNISGNQKRRKKTQGISNVTKTPCQNSLHATSSQKVILVATPVPSPHDPLPPPVVTATPVPSSGAPPVVTATPMPVVTVVTATPQPSQPTDSGGSMDGRQMNTGYMTSTNIEAGVQIEYAPSASDIYYPQPHPTYSCEYEKMRYESLNEWPQTQSQTDYYQWQQSECQPYVPQSQAEQIFDEAFDLGQCPTPVLWM
jgi:hypothetical protein